jgi:hypothetical protein
MASATEISLGDLRHIYLVRHVRHLEYRVMAFDALEPLSHRVFFMVKDCRRGLVGCEGQITAATFCAIALNGINRYAVTTAITSNLFTILSLSLNVLSCTCS